MTAVLDVDPALVGIAWRENIHVELTIDVQRKIDGSARDVRESPEVLDLDPELYPKFLHRVQSIYDRGPVSRQTLGTAVSPYGFRASTRGPSFLFVHKTRAYALPAQQLNNGAMRVSFNVTNFFDRQQVPQGSWAIYPVHGEILGPPVAFDLSQYPALPDLSRVFTHTGNKEADTVTFVLNEDEERPEIRVRAYQFSRETKSSSMRRAVREFPRRVFLAVREFVLDSTFRLARKRRLDRPTILFASEQREVLEGNLKAIHDRMYERGLNKQFKIMKHFKITTSANWKARLQQTRLIARAHYLVIDDFFPRLESLKLDDSVQVIQAWHAGVGFKAVGYARYGNLGSPPRENAHRTYTWAIAGAKSLIPIYSDVFGIEPEAVVPTGLPRIDAFLSGEENAKADFVKSHPEVAGKKLVLFAPTYRGRGIHDAYYDYDQIDFKALYDYCGDDTVIGIRMHHFITDRDEIPAEYADRFIDLSDYPDGLGLLHSVDLLITDYSSIIYEYALLDRPMVFYAYDRDAYAATRGFQQDYDDAAPGKVCLSSAELITALSNEDYEAEKVTAFREKNFDSIDTGSTDRFIDWFFLNQMPKEF